MVTLSNLYGVFLEMVSIIRAPFLHLSVALLLRSLGIQHFHYRDIHILMGRTFYRIWGTLFYQPIEKTPFITIVDEFFL